MTTFEISTGKWFLANGTLFGTGFAGHGDGKNNPDMQGVVGVGPLPIGVYHAVGMREHDPRTGWYTIVLEPEPMTRNYILSLGRNPDTFRIHGDSMDHTGESSDGCMVFDRSTRLDFWKGDDKEIHVVTGPKPPQVTSYPRYL